MQLQIQMVIIINLQKSVVTTAGFVFRKGCINWFKVVYFSVKGLIIKCINLYQFEGDYFGIWKVERSRCERIMET